MASPTKFKIGITESVKVDQYQYVKPYFEIEVSLNPGDNFKDQVDLAKKHLFREVEQLVKDIQAKGH